MTIPFSIFSILFPSEVSIVTFTSVLPNPKIRFEVILNCSIGEISEIVPDDSYPLKIKPPTKLIFQSISLAIPSPMLLRVTFIFEIPPIILSISIFGLTIYIDVVLDQLLSEFTISFALTLTEKLPLSSPD